MIKRMELSNPNSCLNRARDDEMVFTILERDAAAPSTVRHWVSERIRLGKNKLEDDQIHEALAAADYMEKCQATDRRVINSLDPTTPATDPVHAMGPSR
jgi:hypothetical protein